MYEKPSKLRAAILGGLVIGAISGIPGLNLLNCCCCAGVLFGGALAFYLYKEEHVEGMEPLEASDALILGIFAGIAGALTATVLQTMVTFLFGPIEAKMMQHLMQTTFQRMEDRGMLPPGTIDQMQDQFERSIQESRSLMGILSGLVITLIVYPIFSMLGGLIGFSMFGRKKPAQPTTPHQ